MKLARQILASVNILNIFPKLALGKTVIYTANRRREMCTSEP